MFTQTTRNIAKMWIAWLEKSPYHLPEKALEYNAIGILKIHDRKDF